MGNVIQLKAIQDLRKEIKDMKVGESKTFTCPYNFSNEAVVAIITRLVEDRGIAYGFRPAEATNQFIVYTTADVIDVRLL